MLTHISIVTVMVNGHNKHTSCFLEVSVSSLPAVQDHYGDSQSHNDGTEHYDDGNHCVESHLQHV